ncbi:MAG TPA: hypothetical protein VD997_12135 [Phycisphaerales bacterium]|nr:hypothetical protein [Phycisphaerales bacterium]
MRPPRFNDYQRTALGLGAWLVAVLVMALWRNPSLEALGMWAQIFLPMGVVWGLWIYIVYRHRSRRPAPPEPPPTVPAECPACRYPLQSDWCRCPECGRPTLPIVVKPPERILVKDPGHATKTHD